MRSAQSARLLIALPGLLLIVAGCGGKTTPPAGPTAAPLASVVIRTTHTPLERSVDGTVEAVNQATVVGPDERPRCRDPVRRQRCRARRRRDHTAEGNGTARRTAGCAGGADRSESTQCRGCDQLPAHRRSIPTPRRLEGAIRPGDRQSRCRRRALGRRRGRAHDGTRRRRLHRDPRALWRRRHASGWSRSASRCVPARRLMTGLSLRDLRVETNIPQSIVMQVRRLKQAAVYVGDQRIEATKITIFPEAATPSSTFRARLDLPPGRPRSRARHVRQSRPRHRRRRIGCWCPRRRVVERSEVTGVYVIDSRGQVSLRYVRPGHRFGDRTRDPRRALSPGERVALDPIAASARIAPPASAVSDASRSASAAGSLGSSSRTS